MDPSWMGEVSKSMQPDHVKNAVVAAEEAMVAAVVAGVTAVAVMVEIEATVVETEATVVLVEDTVVADPMVETAEDMVVAATVASSSLTTEVLDSRTRGYSDNANFPDYNEYKQMTLF